MEIWLEVKEAVNTNEFIVIIKKFQLMKLLCQYYFGKLSSSSEGAESASYTHGIRVSSPCGAGWGPLSWVQGPSCLMWFLVGCLAAVYKQRQGQLSQGHERRISSAWSSDFNLHGFYDLLMRHRSLTVRIFKNFKKQMSRWLVNFATNMYVGQK